MVKTSEWQKKIEKEMAGYVEVPFKDALMDLYWQ